MAAGGNIALTTARRALPKINAMAMKRGRRRGNAAGTAHGLPIGVGLAV
jgi:hypothetical protein